MKIELKRYNVQQFRTAVIFFCLISTKQASKDYFDIIFINVGVLFISLIFFFLPLLNIFFLINKVLIFLRIKSQFNKHLVLEISLI